MNKTKTKLFKKYLQKSQNIFLELMINPDIEFDVEAVCNAVKTSKHLEEEPINIIVISSLMTWIETNPYEYFKVNHPEAFEYFLKKFRIPNMFEDSRKEPTEVTIPEDDSKQESENQEEKEQTSKTGVQSDK